MDNHLREQVLPAVMQADNVEVMSSLLSGGIQQYLRSNYASHTQHTRKHLRKLHQRALKPARDKKVAMKKQLRALRRRSDIIWKRSAS
jgi:hypothetical protein